MELSKTIFTEPISRARRIARGIALMHGFTDRHTQPPFMAMSEHYHTSNASGEHPTPVDLTQSVQLTLDMTPDHLTQPVLGYDVASQISIEEDFEP